MNYEVCRQCGNLIVRDEGGMPSNFSGEPCRCPQVGSFVDNPGIEYVWQKDVRDLTKAVQALTEAVLKLPRPQVKVNKPLFDSAEEYLASTAAKEEEEGE